MRPRYVLACAAVALISLIGGDALAYVDVGTDPPGDDVGQVPIADVVWTKRSVWRNEDGRRWFRVAVRTRRPLRETNADIVVRIDSRGDEHADLLMRIVMFEGKGCGVRVSAGRSRSGRVRMTGDLASCVVPLRWVDPGGKRIRWRLLSQPHEGGSAYHTDRAPNHGWYRRVDLVPPARPRAAELAMSGRLEG